MSEEHIPLRFEVGSRITWTESVSDAEDSNTHQYYTARYQMSGIIQRITPYSVAILVDTEGWEKLFQSVSPYEKRVPKPYLASRLDMEMREIVLSTIPVAEEPVSEVPASTPDAKHCFRCEKHLPASEFKRHALVLDKSPILSEVCHRCYKKIKEKVAAHRSIAHQFGGVSTLTPSEWLEKLWESQGHCQYCKRYTGYINLIIEHMTPLSQKGGNTKDNVVPACISCNSSKGGRDVETWHQQNENYNLLIDLQEHLGLSKSEVTNLAIRLLAQREGLLLEEDEMEEGA
jgi:5-methylcytosine-specific restriction endonuclease McrA